MAECETGRKAKQRPLVRVSPDGASPRPRSNPVLQQSSVTRAASANINHVVVNLMLNQQVGIDTPAQHVPRIR